MKKNYTWIMVTIFILACNAPFLTHPPTPTAAPVIPTFIPPEKSPAWNLTFRDEFNKPELDSAWTTEYTWGRVNPPELQYYSADAFEFQNGILRIKAEEKTSHDLPYTSGLISSFNSYRFTYGYAEARVQIPSGKGIWPAFWLLDANPMGIGEIDVMEIIGSEPNVVNMTLHFPDVNGKSQAQGEIFSGPDYSKDFHLFAVDWRADSIVWYVDGVERYRLAQNIPHAPMYLIANLAVGGKWPGPPNSLTRFPAYYGIDYIRVYQQK